jgi:CRP/FNR family transcriptional regulator
LTDITDIRKAWSSSFPQLQPDTDPALQSVIAATRLVDVPAGETVFSTGMHCENYLLVTQGSVRVQQLAASGREIVLYRVGPGESCVLTTSCLMSDGSYPAEGITESAVSALVIPAPVFHTAMQDSEQFRSFVMNNFSLRIADLLTLIEEITFRRIDSRLAARLIQLADIDGNLRLTHQDLATELGSAREVISRMLKEFERKGWIRLGRGTIKLRDTESLTGLAQCD